MKSGVVIEIIFRNLRSYGQKWEYVVRQNQSTLHGISPFRCCRCCRWNNEEKQRIHSTIYTGIPSIFFEKLDCLSYYSNQLNCQFNPQISFRRWLWLRNNVKNWKWKSRRTLSRSQSIQINFLITFLSYFSHRLLMTVCNRHFYVQNNQKIVIFSTMLKNVTLFRGFYCFCYE